LLLCSGEPLAHFDVLHVAQLFLEALERHEHVRVAQAPGHHRGHHLLHPPQQAVHKGAEPLVRLPAVKAHELGVDVLGVVLRELHGLRVLLQDLHHTFDRQAGQVVEGRGHAPTRRGLIQVVLAGFHAVAGVFVLPEDFEHLAVRHLRADGPRRDDRS